MNCCCIPAVTHRSTINRVVQELVLRGVTVKNQCFVVSLLVGLQLATARLCGIWRGTQVPNVAPVMKTGCGLWRSTYFTYGLPRHAIQLRQGQVFVQAGQAKENAVLRGRSSSFSYQVAICL
jgi:hypothetical protein